MHNAASCTASGPFPLCSVAPHVAVCDGVRAALLLRGAAARHALLLALGLSHLEAEGARQELTPTQQAHLQARQQTKTRQADRQTKTDKQWNSRAHAW